MMITKRTETEGEIKMKSTKERGIRKATDTGRKRGKETERDATRRRGKKGGKSETGKEGEKSGRESTGLRRRGGDMR